MSTLRLVQYTVTPPDRFRFRFAEDGFVVRNFSYTGWLDGIKTHARNNGYPIPTVEEAEDQLCRTLSGEWCQYTDGRPSQGENLTRFTLDDFKRGTQVFIAHLANGAKVVAQEVAEERALTCSRCFMNMEIPGCSACHAVANLVADASGAGTTKSDSMLKACSWCGCSAQANVWMPTEVSGAGVTDDMLELAPSFCWKANEIREARLTNRGSV